MHGDVVTVALVSSQPLRSLPLFPFSECLSLSIHESTANWQRVIDERAISLYNESVTRVNRKGDTEMTQTQRSELDRAIERAAAEHTAIMAWGTLKRTGQRLFIV